MAKILCIEDEASLRRCLVEELEDAGYATLEATDGEQGLDVIRKEKPDLVISDIRMPKMDGHTLLRTLRDRHPECDDLPFVFLSALGDRQAIIEGRQLGADAYLTKPVDFELLLVEVQSRLAQMARMARQKEEELVRLYKAMARKGDAEARADGEAPAAAPPRRLVLTQLHNANGQPFPLYFCTSAGPAPEARDGLAPCEQDKELLRIAGLTIKADLAAGVSRLLVIDVHEKTAWDDKLFQEWRSVCDGLAKDVRHELGVRIVGLPGARVLAQASGLARRMSELSRIPVLEVDFYGLEVLAEMAPTFRFVSINAALLADPASSVRKRARAYIGALHDKGAKVILRGCTTPALRKLNRDLAADFYC